jgi:hypothetical protein
VHDVDVAGIIAQRLNVWGFFSLFISVLLMRCQQMEEKAARSQRFLRTLTRRIIVSFQIPSFLSFCAYCPPVHFPH